MWILNDIWESKRICNALIDLGIMSNSWTQFSLFIPTRWCSVFFSNWINSVLRMFWIDWIYSSWFFLKSWYSVFISQICVGSKSKRSSPINFPNTKIKINKKKNWREWWVFEFPPKCLEIAGIDRWCIRVEITASALVYHRPTDSNFLVRRSFRQWIIVLKIEDS